MLDTDREDLQPGDKVLLNYEVSRGHGREGGGGGAGGGMYLVVGRGPWGWARAFGWVVGAWAWVGVGPVTSEPTCLPPKLHTY